MKELLTELLNTLYEAEGLVEMALRRKERNPGHVARLALDKCFQVARLASEVRLPETGDETSAEDEEPFYGPEAVAAKAEESSRPVAEEDEVDVFTREILPRMSDGLAKADIFDGSAFNDDSEDETGFADEGDAVEEDVSGEDAPIAAISRRRPIIGFFSINDKFRFRRGLFAGSDTAFREVLALLEGMSDLAEARGYLFRELDWDPENHDVKAFISILERYYK